jgi:uncharacterized membrane protein
MVRALVAAGVLWLAVILLAPLAIASSHGVLSLGAACTYAAGSRICHQRPARCFWIHGRPMPVCARCTGIYAGAAVAGLLGLVFASGWASAWSSRRARLALALAALPTVVSWGLEYAGFAHPPNAVRAILALPLGFVAAWVVVSTLTDGPRPDHDNH